MTAFERLEGADLLPEEAAALFSYWQQCYLSGAGPTRTEFDPLRLWRWLGKLDVYVVENKGEAFRLRLSGTDTVELTGEDWTGKTARDVDEAYGRGFHDDLAAVMRTRTPALHRMQVFQKDYITAYRLLLPVFAAPGDGEVTQIFLAMFWSTEG